jgi:hypothetical protein
MSLGFQKQGGEEMKKLVFGIAAALLITALLVPAKSVAADGFLLGLGVGAGIPTGDFKDAKTGFASYLDVGYGFNKYVTVGGYFGSDNGTEKDSGTSITWYQPYFGAYGRFTIPVGESLEPYVNVGLGAYLFSASGGDLTVYSKSPTLGFKFGGGLNWFLGKSKKWFIGPEIAYQYVPYDQNFKVDFDGYKTEGKVNDNLSVIELMVKFGYQWKK